MNSNTVKQKGGVIGAMIGDIVGSIYEFSNIRTKEFTFFKQGCFFTDDSVMTLAVARALLNSREKGTALYDELVSCMQTYGRDYPGRGYGGHFADWIFYKTPKPYNSWGNGAPMRCSAAGMIAKSAEEAYELGVQTAMPTHNHIYAKLAAGLTAELVWRANSGESMEQLRARAEEVLKKYPEGCSEIKTCDEIRPYYDFTESSQGTMYAALAAFFESTSYEDAIRNAISLGGDSDTVAAITGAVAEAYWGIPDDIREKGLSFLFNDDGSPDERLLKDIADIYALANK